MKWEIEERRGANALHPIALAPNLLERKAMLRELLNEEQTLVSGGQTADELAVTQMLSDYGGIVSTDGNYGTTANGITAWDMDGNGWYEGAAWETGPAQSLIFDPGSGNWLPWEDIEHKDVPQNEGPMG